MIPDFPAEKEIIMQFLSDYVNDKSRELSGFIRDFQSHKIHEGHQWQINRSDGSTELNPFNEIGTTFFINLNDVPDFTIEDLFNKLDTMAKEFAEQMVRQFFETINKSIPKLEIDNDKTNSEHGFSKELLLRMYESVDIDFDEMGNPHSPTIILSQNLWEQKKDEIQSWENDVEFIEKRNKIILQKRKDWLERESNRKLVD